MSIKAAGPPATQGTGRHAARSRWSLNNTHAPEAHVTTEGTLNA